jgi:hypothetical protein
MSDDWVCLECGARQADTGACRACSEPTTHDMRKEDVRELMRDIDQRHRDRTEKLSRWTGVVVGVGLVFGAWLVPGYWSARGTVYPGLPFFFDQWLLMAAIGLVVMFVMQRVLAKQRFPYLE